MSTPNENTKPKSAEEWDLYLREMERVPGNWIGIVERIQLDAAKAALTKCIELSKSGKGYDTRASINITKLRDNLKDISEL